MRDRVETDNGAWSVMLGPVSIVALAVLVCGCAGGEPSPSVDAEGSAAGVGVAAAAGASSVQSPAAAAAAVPLISHAAVVEDDLLFGGPPTETALQMLAEAGFASVGSLLGEGELSYDEQAAVETAGMHFFRIPVLLPFEEITDEMIDAFDVAMREAPRPMLLHCMAGNATASLYAVWLSERGGMEPEEAVQRGLAVGLTHSRPVVEARLGLGESS